MEYENIKKLMDDMGNSKLTSIDIDFPDGTKISMKKDAASYVVKEVKEESVIATSESLEEKEETKVADKKGNIIKSPMVGTFYLKPSPTSEPYVTVGKNINKGDTVCIVEAMKLMNEIESEFTGVVKEILVKDGEPVEYGADLFIIE